MTCKQLTKEELGALREQNPEVKGFLDETDCNEECGVCCVPPQNSCWMCDCTFNDTGSTNKSNCVDFGPNSFYFSEDCAAYPSPGNCVVEASVGRGDDTWAGEECAYVIYTPAGAEMIHRGTNPPDFPRWAYMPDGERLMVFGGLYYPGQPYWTSNNTYQCDCLLGDEAYYDWVDDEGEYQTTRAFRLWQMDCSGNFNNVTSLYIESVLAEGPNQAGGCFDWDVTTSGNILTSPIPEGITYLTPTTKPGIGECIVVTDGDGSKSMPEEYWSLVSGEPRICLGRGGAPDYTCLPDGSGYCTIDQMPQVSFNCDPSLSKSDCSGVWHPGQDCSNFDCNS